MVLEAVIVCLDNSDWTRNGDYHPSRWESEVEAANLISESKCERNPENGIGLISMAGKRVEVHVSLTNDLARVLNAVRGIKVAGESDFITSLNIATLTLKHRQNKNQKQRIILFIGSPIKHSVEEMIQIGKKLKKYNIAVDVISFGNIDENREHISRFIEAVNNSNNSSILEVPVGFYIMDSLFTSPIMSDMGYGDVQMENFGGEGMVSNPNVNANTNANVQPGTTNVNQQGVGMSQFERDINLAIQNSLEEERRRAQQQTGSNVQANVGTTANKGNEGDVEMKPVEEENEEEELEKAKLLSMQEHEQVVKRKNEEDDKVKDQILENQDFIKDILQGIDSTDLNDADLKDVMEKLKENKDKDNKKDNKNDDSNKDRKKEDDK